MAERFYQKDYKYPTKGKGIENFAEIIPEGILYEIRCGQCDLAARTQGINVERIYNQFIQKGCPSCGGKNISIKEVAMKNENS